VVGTCELGELGRQRAHCRRAAARVCGQWGGGRVEERLRSGAACLLDIDR